MEFYIHTYDLQLMDILLILRDKKQDLCPENTERLERIQSLIGELNNLCDEENDYTLKVTVSPANK